MVLKRTTFSQPVLKSLVDSKTSCVYCVKDCKRCFNLTPAQMGNLKSAVSEHLSSKVTTYDSELQGIIMSHKNIKVVNSLQLSDEGEYRLDYIADIYIFKPSVGNILTGRVNKKSQDHLGVLVHSMFNATLPRPRFDDECPKTWAGASVKIGEQVTFEVLKVNFMSRLPCIKGKLIHVDEKRDNEDGDSGIGGHESTEESSALSGLKSPDPLTKKKTILKKRHSSSTTDQQSAKRLSVNFNTDDTSFNKTSLLELQSSLLGEIMDSNDSSSEYRNKSDSQQVSSGPRTDTNIGNIKTKKRKRKSSLLEIENSLIQNAYERLTSPDFSNEEVKPKLKRRKVTESEDAHNSAVSDLEMNTQKIKKKTPNNIRSSAEIPEEESEKSSFSESILSIQEGKKKKKKKSNEPTEEARNSLSEESLALLRLAEQGDLLGTPPTKKKKKVKKESLIFVNTQETEESEKSTLSPSVGMCAEQTIGEEYSSASLNDSVKKHKKKKKALLGQDDTTSSPYVGEICVTEEPRHKKKKKRSTLLAESEDNIQDTTENAREISLCTSSPDIIQKTKKKKKSFSIDIPEEGLPAPSSRTADEAVMYSSDIALPDQGNKKKKKKSRAQVDELESNDTLLECDVSLGETHELGAISEHKKKKKKKSKDYRMELS